MPKTPRSPLWSQNASFIVKIGKIRMEKTPVLKKKFGYSMLGKPNLKAKNHLAITHSAESCKRWTLGFLKIQLDAKYQKNEGNPSETIKNFRKKSHKAEITSIKKLVKYETRTHVLLHRRPLKILINLCAKWQWRLQS